jgi:ribosomal protein S18 acetylase RimI-like enzyme
MLTIETYKPEDFGSLIDFVSAIQEHERVHVPELKMGKEIGKSYAARLIENVTQKNGIILMACQGDKKIGFACSWIGKDDDPLLREEFSLYAYVSDIFVSEFSRGQGVGHLLMDSIEKVMSERGCVRIRVCSKGTNRLALKLYENSGYQPYEIIFAKTIGA